MELLRAEFLANEIKITVETPWKVEYFSIQLLCDTTVLGLDKEDH